MPTANVTLNITQFNAAPTPCVISRPVISTSGGGQRVKYKKPDDPNDNTIVIMKKGAASLDIVFDIPGCTPTGSAPVSFDGANAGANFTGAQPVNGSSVTVTDVFANLGNGPDNPRWKYSITIQNAQGVAGIIDPDIENQN